jgi:hypothetical protein
MCTAFWSGNSKSKNICGKNKTSMSNALNQTFQHGSKNLSHIPRGGLGNDGKDNSKQNETRYELWKLPICHNYLMTGKCNRRVDRNEHSGNGCLLRHVCPLEYKTKILDIKSVQDIIKCKFSKTCVKKDCNKSHDCSAEERSLNSFYNFINRITNLDNPIEKYVLQIINLIRSDQWLTSTKVYLQQNIEYTKKLYNYNKTHMDEIQLIIGINEANLSGNIEKRDELFIELKNRIRRELSVDFTNDIFIFVGLNDLLNNEFIKTINDINEKELKELQNTSWEKLPTATLINEREQILRERLLSNKKKLEGKLGLSSTSN